MRNERIRHILFGLHSVLNKEETLGNRKKDTCLPRSKEGRITKDGICEHHPTRLDETEGRVILGSTTFERTAIPDLHVRIDQATFAGTPIDSEKSNDRGSVS